MRKFNLKGTVIQRMRGIEREEPRTVENEKTQIEEAPVMSVDFTEEQGVFACAWRTDVGRLRKNNQDAVILGNGLAGVADGMGGHKGGEIASAGLRDGLLRETKDSRPSREKLEEAVQKVNRELWEQQEGNSSLSGMGTTLTVLWPTEKEMLIGQVGDSRAYLLRDNVLTQITNDHSMVADMVRKGVLTEEQAACHPMRNYITRAVGTEANIEIDMYTHNRRKGDRWLICSDGLHGMISTEELIRLMAEEDLEKAADNLLQAALSGGGKDNISLVLIQDDTEREYPDEEPDAEDQAETVENEPDGEASEEVKPQ
ncbi:MAG: Stp1/IreP family PP2C-type Ser/Thr phosphatase [Clostridia bacterium]|nr:Stp1/IreP family PP2C-type Ser/Thr phosphatase [Clostridia bacterium]